MKIFIKKNFVIVLLIIWIQFIFIPVREIYASATSPNLGQAASFSVLAGASMSAAAAGTTVSGDLGLSTGLEASKTGPWTVGGSQYFGPLSLAATARTDALAAYNNLAGQSSDGAWSTSPWSPVPGVWTAASDITFTGTITLNGGYDDVWVFQVGRDMTFSGSIVLTGNAQPCNVFWQVGRSATIASGSTFAGTLIASTGSVTLVSGATVNGRIFVLDVSLTTDGNSITGPTCNAAPTSTPTPTPTPTTTLTPTSTPTPTPTSTSSLSSSSSSSSTSSSTSSSGSSTSTPVCVDTPPTNNPDLFQIDRAGSKATLYFAPVSNNLSYYYVAYGLSPGSEQYGVSFSAGLSTGAVSYTVNELDPNTTYYFKVRGGNGCAPGGWSNNRESNSKNPSLPNAGFGPYVHKCK